MKFTCTQENFARGLSLVSRIASKNVALPILNNVLIEATPGGVILKTTNLEVGIQVHVRAKVEQPGIYTVQSRLLSDFVTLMGNEKVDVELTEAGLRVTSGHSATLLKGLPGEEFPVLPSGDPIVTTTVPGGVFVHALEGVVFAAASDESRPEISGVVFRIKGDSLIVAATDSYRLAERRLKLTQTAAQSTETIVPARAIHELIRVAPQTEQEVKIMIGENHATFELGDSVIVTRLIEGKYPEYEQIIPKDWQTKARVSSAELIEQVRAASLFCKPGINDITLEFSPDKKHTTISAANTTVGEHQSTLELTIEGAPVSIVFNYRYLLEGVQSLPGDEVVMELGHGQAPGVLRGAHSEDGLYLLMPIRQ